MVSITNPPEFVINWSPAPVKDIPNRIVAPCMKNALVNRYLKREQIRLVSLVLSVIYVRGICIIAFYNIARSLRAKTHVLSE